MTRDEAREAGRNAAYDAKRELCRRNGLGWSATESVMVNAAIDTVRDRLEADHAAKVAELQSDLDDMGEWRDAYRQEVELLGAIERETHQLAEWTAVNAEGYDFCALERAEDALAGFRESGTARCRHDEFDQAVAAATEALQTKVAELRTALDVLSTCADDIQSMDEADELPRIDELRDAIDRCIPVLATPHDTAPLDRARAAATAEDRARCAEIADRRGPRYTGGTVGGARVHDNACPCCIASDIRDGTAGDGPVYEARSHLGAALAQTLDTDDEIIMGHVRDAFRLLGGKPMRADTCPDSTDPTDADATLERVRGEARETALSDAADAVERHVRRWYELAECKVGDVRRNTEGNGNACSGARGSILELMTAAPATCHDSADPSGDGPDEPDRGEATAKDRELSTAMYVAIRTWHACECEPMCTRCRAALNDAEYLGLKAGLKA